jgi:hypothetical protein
VSAVRELDSGVDMAQYQDTHAEDKTSPRDWDPMSRLSGSGSPTRRSRLVKSQNNTCDKSSSEIRGLTVDAVRLGKSTRDAASLAAGMVLTKGGAVRLEGSASSRKAGDIWKYQTRRLKA